MLQIKFSKEMTFAQFLYANYGFSYTREQEREALTKYYSLLKKHQYPPLIHFI